MKKIFSGYKIIRIIVAFIFSFSIVLLISTCKKESSQNVSNQEEEILTASEIAVLDNMPTTSYTAEDVTLPNGMKLSDYLLQADPGLYYRIYGKKSVSVPEPKAGELQAFEQKNLLLAKMLGLGFALTDRDMFIYPRQGPRTPAQHGLAYSFGQKFYHVRETPPAGTQTLCTDSLYGLDCSGFIYQLALYSGLNLSNDPVDQCCARYEADTMTWVNAFKNTVYKDLHMENLGQYDRNKIEAGDLIFWKDSEDHIYHVGIVLLGSNFNEQIIFMSCGCARSCTADGCINNYSDERGPRQASLAGRFPSRYVVLRVKANMFPYRQVYFGIFSPSVASRAGKEVAGAYNRTWSVPCRMEGEWIVGSKKDNTYGSYIDSVMIKLDPVNHFVNDFKVRRYVVYPEVDNYQHYSIDYLNQKGGPIRGNSDNSLFEVKGFNFTDHIEVISEYNERIQVGMNWVVGDEKLLRLVPDISSGFYITFAP
jgi:hypothetical protein